MGAPLKKLITAWRGLLSPSAYTGGGKGDETSNVVNRGADSDGRGNGGLSRGDSQTGSAQRNSLLEQRSRHAGPCG